MNKILIVASHPDDEILGCGGTILKHIDNWDKVSILILGEGITSRDKKRDIKKRRNEIVDLGRKAIKVSEFLDISRLHLGSYPDNRFDTVPFLDIVKTIEEFKDKIRPNIIYTHYYNDLNIDHKITFQTVMTATRPIEGETVKEIYSFEIPSSTEWNFRNNGFSPNTFIDISNYIDKKIEAFKIYESEIRKFPHPRSPEAIRVKAKMWGSVCGYMFAEAFILIRNIK